MSYDAEKAVDEWERNRRTRQMDRRIPDDPAKREVSIVNRFELEEMVAAAYSSGRRDQKEKDALMIGAWGGTDEVEAASTKMAAAIRQQGEAK